MVAVVARAIKLLEERAEEDEALAEAVRFLADDVAGPDDAFTDVTPGALAAARVVNERRQRQRREDRDAAAVDTAAVIALIGSIHDRKGVDRRRRRGQLLGWRSGARTLHPAWQFDRRSGDTWPGLSRVLAALREVAPDARAADLLMAAPRDDLGGSSLADLLAVGRVDTVVRLVVGAGDQS